MEEKKIGMKGSETGHPWKFSKLEWLLLVIHYATLCNVKQLYTYLLLKNGTILPLKTYMLNA